MDKDDAGLFGAKQTYLEIVFKVEIRSLTDRGMGLVWEFVKSTNIPRIWPKELDCVEVNQ